MAVLALALCAAPARSREPPKPPFARPDAGAPAPFTWDVPGLLRQVRVGDVLWLRGVPTTLFAASSSWKVEALQREYTKRFVRAGFFVPDTSEPLPGLPLPRVTAVDPATELVYTVLLMDEADGTTTLFLGASDSARRERRGQSSTVAPLFPGARHVFETRLEGVRAVSYAALGTPDEVRRFYVETLPKHGFVREGTSDVWIRGEEQLQVALGPLEAGVVPVAVTVQPLPPSDPGLH